MTHPAAAQAVGPAITMDADVSTPRTHAGCHEPPVDYDKRLMLFSGRANPELAAKIGDKLGVDLGPITLKTFNNGEVYCRYEESIRGADVFLIQPTCGNPGDGHQHQRRADGAAGDDRRGRRRLRPPRHRRHAVVRLQPPGQEVARRASRSAPASSPACSRPRAPTAS